MGMIKPALWTMGALLIVACSDSGQREEAPNQTPSVHREQPVQASVEGTALAHFQPNGSWQLVEEVVADGATLETIRGENNTIAVNGDAWADSGHLETYTHVGDGIVRMEFMLPEGASAGLYLLSRYEISLADSYGKIDLEPSDMGGLAHRWNPSRENPEFDGVAPSVNAAKPAGQWQTLEAEFRAPRYDDAGAKTENALLLSVTINGVQVQHNTIATGFTR